MTPKRRKSKTSKSQETHYDPMAEALRAARQVKPQEETSDQAPAEQVEEQLKKTSIYLPPSIHKRLRQIALDRDISLNNVFLEAINTYLDSKES